MERPTYPFPLAANSSHHSHYHRFLLGADPAILAPFPKPYCIGALSGPMRRLAENLDLQRWRKLYHGAFPWVEGFGPEHYDLGNVAPHRPLPRAYGRPLRKFGAFDFVQVADPSVSALALVAGDQRVLERFIALSDDFCARLEAGAGVRASGPVCARATGRMLAGLFVEPNNRWLMPFLHVHMRVLNFTSFEQAPGRLACIDPVPMAREAEKARRQWIGLQAAALSELGYRVTLRGGLSPALCIDGVSMRLVAAMEAPRIAVLRLLERIIAGDREPSAERLGAELPPAVIAAMAEQLESVLARSLSIYKPAKIGIPSEGPWRGAVREHMFHHCPEALAKLDAAATRARAVLSESAVFSTPPLDPAHCHAPGIESIEAPDQMPIDPELGAGCAPSEPEQAVSRWLVLEFGRTLAEVNEQLVRTGLDDPFVSLRGMLATIDGLSEGADPEQLRQSAVLLGVELERMARGIADDAAWSRRHGRGDRVPLATLDELFETAEPTRMACEQEIGGRSL
jgi:hypothetical protein